MVVFAMPDSPLSRRFHTASMEWPIGVTQPMPVMTTRFMVQPSEVVAAVIMAGFCEQHAYESGRSNDDRQPVTKPREEHQHRNPQEQRTDGGTKRGWEFVPEVE